MQQRIVRVRGVIKDFLPIYSSGLVILTLLCSLLLAACGDNTATPAASAPTAQATTQAAATTAPATTQVAATTALAATTTATTTAPAATTAAAASTVSSGPPVTLKLTTWFTAENAKVIEEVNNRFHAAYPNITVEIESIAGDYETVLKTRLAAGDAPDIFWSHPGRGSSVAYAKNGYTLDVSDQPWVSRLDKNARSIASLNSKVYGLPYDQNVIAVIYNKKIFSDLGISIPKNWDEFTQAAQKIKAANIIPIAQGLKDQWPLQLIPLAMGSSAIYRDDPSFDQKLYDGQTNFVASAWSQMLKDYQTLDTSGFFNKGILGTGYDDSGLMLATGKAAMIVDGSWVIPGLKKQGPTIDYGMFPLPYNKPGQNTWAYTAVGAIWNISATTKQADAARKYLEFVTRPETVNYYMNNQRAFTTLTDVTVNADPTLNEMVPYLKVGSATGADWPTGVADIFIKDMQGVFSGANPVDTVLQDMDKTFQQNKNK